ncbi:MAG: response regulator [Bacteroidales bacterium]|nr:response regulator [Bacteroidales bacterium]MBS3775891.1 response regulator [Bacteroidales bacterium]
MRILIAESNELIGSLIQSILDRNGHSTYLASDGIEAFRMLNLSNFDLVITEILLPYYTGLEVLHFINNQDHKPKTIVLSSVQNMDTVYKAYQLNADSYLTKPFNPDRLPQEIEMLSMDISDQLDIDSRIIVDDQHLSEEAIQKILKITKYLIHRISMPELGLYNTLTGDALWIKLVMLFCITEEEELPRHLTNKEAEFNRFKESLSLDVLLSKDKERENYISRVLREFHVTRFPDIQASQINGLMDNPMVIDDGSFVLLNEMDHTAMEAREIRNHLVYRAPSFNFRTASEYMIDTGLSVDVMGMDMRIIGILRNHLRLKVNGNKLEKNREVYEFVEHNMRHACERAGIPLAYLHKMLKFSQKDSISLILNDL